MHIPKEQLNGKVTFHWRISRVFRTAFFSMPFCAIMFVALIAFGYLYLAIVLPVLYILFRFFYALIWPSFEHLYYRYELREHDLLVQQGVLFRKWSSIPLHRIQHIDMHQGPLQRIIGLVTLQIYTASGTMHDGAIPGLLPYVAQELQQKIISKRGDDGV